jgi:hypothetical protein
MPSRLFALAIALGWVFPHGAFAQAKHNNSSLAAIFADWQHRQGLFNTARYVVTGTTEFKDALPPGDSIRPKRTVLLLDLEGKRFRQESSEYIMRQRQGGGWEYTLRVGTSAFNGKALQGLTHRDLNDIKEDVPDLSIDKGDLARSDFDAHLWPVFFAHGFVPTVHHYLQPDKLPTSYDPENFEVQGSQSFQGRSCTVVRTEPVAGNPPIFDELWIDRDQKSAIHRHVSFSGSNPFFRHDVEWHQLQSGWWPEKWTLTWTMNGQIKRVHRLRVESFEPNVAVTDNDFTLPAEPGMKVIVGESPSLGTGLDPYRPATRTYRISPTGSWDEIAAHGFTTLQGEELPPARGRAWILWSVASGVLMLVVAYYYYVS